MEHSQVIVKKLVRLCYCINLGPLRKEIKIKLRQPAAKNTKVEDGRSNSRAPSLHYLNDLEEVNKGYLRVRCTTMWAKIIAVQ